MNSSEMDSKSRQLGQFKWGYQHLKLTALCFTLCLTKSLVLLQAGASHGRLSLPGVYDDITYFCDGVGRLFVYDRSGFWGLLSNLWSSPPHSPSATLLAFAGFSVLGLERFAPYLMNGVAAASIMAVFFVILRANLAIGLLLSLFLMSTRFFDLLITTFHPDLLLGFSVAVVCFALVEMPLTAISYRNAAFIGLLVGLSLLIKPVAAPMVGLLLALAIAGSLIVEQLLTGTVSRSFPRVAGLFCVLTLVAGIIAGPYYLRSFWDIYDYILAGLVRQHDTWAFHGGLVDHLTYYPHELANELGWVLKAGLLAWLVRLIMIVIRKDKHEAGRQIVFIVLLLVAYGGPTVPDVKTPFFGAIFYALFLVIVSANVQRLLLDMADTGGKSKLLAPVIGMGLFVASILEVRDRQERFSSPRIAEINSLFLETFGELRSDIGKRSWEDSNVPELMMPFPAPIAPHAYVFEAYRAGFQLGISGSPYTDSLPDLEILAKRATYILVPDADWVASTFHYPVSDLMQPFLRWLLREPSFKLLGVASTREGRCYLFRRID